MEFNKPRQWTWEHCSFRCRYVFIPEFRGRPTEAELNYESLSNEEYCRLIRNEFAKLLTLIVNEMSVIEPRQAKTSANSRERTKTLSRPENRRERLESASEQKRHTGEGKTFYWGYVGSAGIFSTSFENRHSFSAIMKIVSPWFVSLAYTQALTSLGILHGIFCRYVLPAGRFVLPW